jgi:dihydrofolate reductase
MLEITAFENISLDGVMQAPGRSDEDTRDGFQHGGWAIGYQDDVTMEFAAESMQGESGMLFGRRTYEDLLGYWTSTVEPNPFTDVLVNETKYVVSRSQDTTLQWPNSTLLLGDAVEHVTKLHQKTDLPLTILGSGELVRSLQPAGLIDRYVLQIHPIILGAGKQLFGPSQRMNLTLSRSVTTNTGVIIAVYDAKR